MAQTRKIQYEPEFESSIIVPTSAAAGKTAISSSSGKIEWKQKNKTIGHSWVIAGKVENESFPGIYIRLATNEEQKLVACKYSIIEGTKVILELKRNGSGATGFTSLECTGTAAEKEPTAISLSTGDFLQLVTKEGSGTPKGLSFTAFIEHI